MCILVLSMIIFYLLQDGYRKEPEHTCKAGEACSQQTIAPNSRQYQPAVEFKRAFGRGVDWHPLETEASVSEPLSLEGGFAGATAVAEDKTIL